MNKKQLYESIMASVAKEVKKVLNEDARFSLRKLYNTVQQFSSKQKVAYITGHSFDDITKILLDEVGNINACFKFPYHKFQAKGKLKQIYNETVAIMPFSKFSMEIEDTNVFYYGNDPVHGRRCFIPFLSDADVYFIDEYKVEEDNSVTFILIKAPSYHEYIN